MKQKTTLRERRERLRLHLLERRPRVLNFGYFGFEEEFTHWGIRFKQRHRTWYTTSQRKFHT